MDEVNIHHQHHTLVPECGAPAPYTGRPSTQGMWRPMGPPTPLPASLRFEYSRWAGRQLPWWGWGWGGRWGEVHHHSNRSNRVVSGWMSGPQPLVNSLHVLEPWVHRFWANLSGWCAGGGWGCGVSGGSECSKSTPSRLIFVAPWHPQTTSTGRPQPLRSCLERGENGRYPHFDPLYPPSSPSTHPHPALQPTPLQPP